MKRTTPSSERCARRWLAAVLLAGVWGWGAQAQEPAAVDDGPAAEPLPFVAGSVTLAVLPDTQYYTMEKMSSGKSFQDRFTAQTEWLAEQREARNIAYVLHLGDVTENDFPDQWAVARAAFDRIEGVIPYLILPGNHDYTYTSSGRTTRLNDSFSFDRTSQWPSFGGAFETGRLDNTYHRLRIHDRDWIVLGLECSPRRAVLDWANQVLAENRDRLAIVVTHAYLDTQNRRLGEGVAADDDAAGPDTYTSGEYLWQNLLRRHANVMFLLCGHKPGEGYRADTGDHGNTVHQILADYQARPGGGNAYLRLLEFLPDGKTVQVKTYSPYRQRHKTDPANQFTITLRAADEVPPSEAAPAQDTGGDASPASPPGPDSLLPLLRRVADWQLANPGTRPATNWVNAVFQTGLAALADLTGDDAYAKALVAMGEAAGWGLAPRRYHADDQCNAQMYLELYRQWRDPRMLGPSQERLDAILAQPSAASLEWGSPGCRDRWSWCDALFMAPPAWARLAYVTQDPRYLAFMNQEWWATTAYLQDADTALFFRDSRFFDQREPNGQKIFWSRGNGWVLAGVVRTLDYLPATFPDYARYRDLYDRLAAAVLKAQQPDGLWRTGLLDPDAHPQPESSGSALLVHGLAAGINRGWLDREVAEEAVLRGWRALAACVRDDGRVEHVQPVGSSPKHFDPTHSEPFGAGALLLAGGEVFRLTGGLPAPRAYARFVPERKDDFAWENDLVAFRAYGPALREGNENSGIDCWLKRVSYPVIDRWYGEEALRGRSYHKDRGEGYDPYHVGASRGCGGLGLWADGRLWTSDVFTDWRLETRTREQVTFVLTYRYADLPGEVVEQKRITLRLGERLCDLASRFTVGGAPATNVTVAVGLTTHAGQAQVSAAPDDRWIACWEAIDGLGLGTGVVLPPGCAARVHEMLSESKDEAQALLLVQPDADGMVTYRAGFGWQGSDAALTNAAAWTAFLNGVAHAAAPPADAAAPEGMAP
ncbi:MAG: glycoside hydrolase family 88 protein [Lentisphaerae bacterium]|nr:glycoside hydrolase family 88 protein [Lentisphaerota bacterium]